MLLNFSHFCHKLAEEQGKYDQYHETSTLMKSTMDIYFNETYMTAFHSSFT